MVVVFQKQVSLGLGFGLQAQQALGGNLPAGHTFLGRRAARSKAQVMLERQWAAGRSGRENPW